MKTIFHVGGWGQNFGDRILQIATTKMFRDCYNRYGQEDLTFVYVDTQKTYWTPQLIERMNEEADMMLVGGGGFLFNRGVEDPNTQSGWQLNMATKDYDKIKIPVVAYGLGYNAFPHDIRRFSKDTLSNIQAFVDKCDLFSLRNNGSYYAMKYLGLDLRKAVVVPDAGMFAEAKPFKHKCFDTEKLKIGVNWATDRPDFRFGSKQDANKVMKLFFIELAEIVAKYNAHVYLIEHLLLEDRNIEVKQKLHEVVQETLGDNATILYKELENELYPPFDYLAPFFADIYRQMDLVLGMRGHSNIISLGQNTPFIGLGHHNKVKWFLEQVGQTYNHIPLNTNHGAAKSVHGMWSPIEDSINNYYKSVGTKEMRAVFNHLSYAKDIFVSKAIDLLRREK